REDQLRLILRRGDLAREDVAGADPGLRAVEVFADHADGPALRRIADTDIRLQAVELVLDLLASRVEVRVEEAPGLVLAGDAGEQVEAVQRINAAQQRQSLEADVVHERQRVVPERSVREALARGVARL